MSKEYNLKERKQLKNGDRIADYIVDKLIGKGGYGDIYHVRSKIHPEAELAMKIEMIFDKKKSYLYNEREILMKLQDSPYFPKFITYGKTVIFRYMVEECLGPSLAAIRKLIPSGHFSLSSSLRIGIESLKAIETLHKHGYLHRDIKPSNFLVRADASPHILLIDYGLARSYLDPNTGKVLPPREKVGFVGTAKYASFNAHENIDLGRRDDLFSWFFSLLEIMTGKLPWISSRDKIETYKSKQRVDIEGFCKSLPKQILSIYSLLKQYSFEDEPDYKLIISYLVKAMEENHCHWDDKYEWDVLSDSNHDEMSAFPQLNLNKKDHHLMHNESKHHIDKKHSGSHSSINESFGSESLQEMKPIKLLRPSFSNPDTILLQQDKHGHIYIRRHSSNDGEHNHKDYHQLRRHTKACLIA